MGLGSPFSSAFIDGGLPHRVLGAPLRRFSLWHLFLLQALDSPFIRLGEVSLFDLQTAVGICLLDFDRSRIRRPRLTLPVLWRLCRRGGLRREVVRFINYTGDYIQKPEYGIHDHTDPKAQPIIRGGAPEILVLAGDIFGWAHWTEKHVWNLPPGRAAWYQSMALRARGADVDFQTEAGRQFEADMAAAGLKPPNQ